MENYKSTLSVARLTKYKTDETDTIDDILENYLYNIKLSESFYPALALLEVTLRNKIDNAIDTIIKKDWLINEFSSDNTILLEKETKIYTDSFQKCIIKKIKNFNFEQRRNKTFANIITIDDKRRVYQKNEIEEFLKKLERFSISITKGDLLPELTFGFWVGLCSKDYNPNIWMKKGVFNDAFPYFNEFVKEVDNNRIVNIHNQLKHILHLRNRIFHHEPIMFNKYLIKNYDDIESLLIYMSNNISDLLCKISNFKKVVK